MRLELDRSVVRQWHSRDLPSLVRHANNAKVAAQLRDRFPHPYSDDAGRGFLAVVASQTPVTTWAIECDGAAVGAIGVELGRDVERVSAEIGYWIGEAYWGRGIITEALRAVTLDAFGRFDLLRIFAVPFADNTGSVKVLEKAGYVIEGHMRQSAIKNGIVRDQLLYAAYTPHPTHHTMHS